MSLLERTSMSIERTELGLWLLVATVEKPKRKRVKRVKVASQPGLGL